MCIQVFHDETDGVSLWELNINQLFDLVSPVASPTSVGHLNMSPSFQWGLSVKLTKKHYSGTGCLVAGLWYEIGGSYEIKVNV